MGGMREPAETVGGTGEGEQHATIHHIEATKNEDYSFSAATMFSAQT